MGRDNFKTVESKLDKIKGKLYLIEGYHGFTCVRKSAGKSKIFHPIDLAELVKKLMIEKSATIYVYPNRKVFHCDSDRSRSIEDLYMVLKNYAPSVTYEQISKIIEKLRKYESHVLTHHYCGTVKREVHGPQKLLVRIEHIREVLGKENIIFKKHKNVGCKEKTIVPSRQNV